MARTREGFDPFQIRSMSGAGRKMAMQELLNSFARTLWRRVDVRLLEGMKRVRRGKFLGLGMGKEGQFS